MFLTWPCASNGYLYTSTSPVIRYVAFALLSPAIVLVAWRLLAFTVKPALYPNEPRELPYWIPYLGQSPRQTYIGWIRRQSKAYKSQGHVFQYVKNSQGVITKGIEYLNNSREPFAITLKGEKLYFLVSADDVSAAYKNTAALAFDKVVHELSITFGVSRDTMDKIYRKPTSKVDDVISQKLQIKNTRLKSLAQLNSDFWRQQLIPGDIYYELQGRFLEHIKTSLQFGNMSGRYVVSSDSISEKTVSLLSWTQEVFVDASLRVFFGDKIMDLEPDLSKHFLKFDDESWKLWYKWPNAIQMHAAKSKLAKTLQRYLALPREERPGAAYIVEKIEETQRALGIPEEDIAKLLCMVAFVSNANTYKVCFWALAHVLHDPALLTTIREENAPAIRPDAPISPQYLMDSCPWLSALFHEALRVCSASSSVRVVTAPTSIGGKELPVGCRVLVPFRQLHFDSSVYGPDVNSFVPERFIRSKKLSHSSSYRPFGGGLSYCPGRFIAQQEVSVFVALVPVRFNVEVVGDKKLPDLDVGKPTNGLIGPKPGEDVILKLTPRL